MHNEALYGRVINWEDIPSEVARPGVSRKAYSTDRVMLVRNELEEGLEVRPHSHHFDQLVQIVHGRCEFYISGKPHGMGPGDIVLVPARSEHYITVTDGPCVNIDLFVPPRSDYMHLLGYLGVRE
jgi:quercetin dioxygenase-like cupin family protein